jgi:hypothetical protein
MDNGRRKYVITRGTEKSSTASIWNEVFPVTLVSKQALLIRVHPEQTLPALMLTNLPHGPQRPRVALPGHLLWRRV